MTHAVGAVVEAPSGRDTDDQLQLLKEIMEAPKAAFFYATVLPKPTFQAPLAFPSYISDKTAISPLALPGLTAILRE